MFLGGGGSRSHIPVYKVDPALAEVAKTGAPQRIVVAWEFNQLLLDHQGRFDPNHRMCIGNLMIAKGPPFQ